MSEKILVPVLGESITEATVAKWLKNEGDTVEADEAIVELETDKVNLEVPSPIDGVLSEINSKDGETVEVGAHLGTITQNGTQPSEKKIITKIEPKKTENNVVNLEIKKEVPKVFKEPEEEEPLITVTKLAVEIIPPTVERTVVKNGAGVVVSSRNCNRRTASSKGNRNRCVFVFVFM